jgi:hypothetical protein
VKAKPRGAPGWAAAQARMSTRNARTVRLRVHEACVIEGDESLGLSAPTGGVSCERCKRVVAGTAVVVQRFRGS